MPSVAGSGGPHSKVGNIEADSIIFVADLLMARALRARNCLLWYSASGKPDLGGKEQDDFRCVAGRIGTSRLALYTLVDRQRPGETTRG